MGHPRTALACGLREVKTLASSYNRVTRLAPGALTIRSALPNIAAQRKVEIGMSHALSFGYGGDDDGTH